MSFEEGESDPGLTGEGSEIFVDEEGVEWLDGFMLPPDNDEPWDGDSEPTLEEALGPSDAIMTNAQARSANITSIVSFGQPMFGVPVKYEQPGSAESEEVEAYEPTAPGFRDKLRQTIGSLALDARWYWENPDELKWAAGGVMRFAGTAALVLAPVVGGAIYGFSFGRGEESKNNAAALEATAGAERCIDFIDGNAGVIELDLIPTASQLDCEIITPIVRSNVDDITDVQMESNFYVTLPTEEELRERIQVYSADAQDDNGAIPIQYAAVFGTLGLMAVGTIWGQSLSGD